MTSQVQIPSKYDIIPVHNSDIMNYLRCRRYWDWTSPSRNNLRRKVMIYGINVDLWYGSGAHYALEMFYNPAIRRDPVEAFTTWFQYQWEGGLVTEDWLDRTYDPNPIEAHLDFVEVGFDIATEKVTKTPTEPAIDPNTGKPFRLWQIMGLRDLHPNPDEAEFMQFKELGINMMTYYRDQYAPKHDDFEVIAAESSFSIPLGFEVRDIREHSPNYGKMLEVHLRGKRDAIIKKIETAKMGIMDHKTKGVISENYVTSLENDTQISDYMWGSQQESILNDLGYDKLDFCLHQALRKVYPKPPTALKSGLPSINRNDESTTPELFTQYIVDHNLQAVYDADEKMQNYYDWLLENGDKNFILRTDVYRNQAQLDNQGEFLRNIAREMTDPDINIYPHPTSDYSCIKCAMRAPCLAKDEGQDWVWMLEDGYERNLDR